MNGHSPANQPFGDVVALLTWQVICCAGHMHNMISTQQRQPRSHQGGCDVLRCNSDCRVNSLDSTMEVRPKLAVPMPAECVIIVVLKARPEPLQTILVYLKRPF
jgi:hypothetical protein